MLIDKILISDKIYDDNVMLQESLLICVRVCFTLRVLYLLIHIEVFRNRYAHLHVTIIVEEWLTTMDAYLGLYVSLLQFCVLNFAHNSNRSCVFVKYGTFF
jgi:hypothetical protein